ncbi:hypothetical protein KJJ93_31590, partial [Escherichia coli]|nr:hypothetical protein [Escherichia coli]
MRTIVSAVIKVSKRRHGGVFANQAPGFLLFLRQTEEENVMYPVDLHMHTVASTHAYSTPHHYIAE